MPLDKKISQPQNKAIELKVQLHTVQQMGCWMDPETLEQTVQEIPLMLLGV